MSFSITTALPGLLDKLYGSLVEPEGIVGFLPDLCRAFDDARGLLHIFDAYAYVQGFQEVTSHLRRAIELQRHVRPWQTRAYLAHSLIELLDVAAVLIDAHGRCLEFNAAAATVIEKSKVGVFSAGHALPPYEPAG